MARIGKGSVEFEDLLPVFTGKLGGEGLIKELCKGFRVDPSTHVAVGDTNPRTEENQFFNGWSFDCFDQNSVPYLPNSSCGQKVPQTYNNDYPFSEIYGSLLDESSPQIMDSFYSTLDTPLNTPPFLSKVCTMQ
ncbi:hypothetical protein GmHk_18G051970 [Glycine max]|nr:hypothetical protein GmHk_18G051970 [Glycine max]